MYSHCHGMRASNCPTLFVSLVVCVCVNVQNKQEEADAVKKRFAGDSQSDHIALLNAFKVHLPGSVEVYISLCQLHIL